MNPPDSSYREIREQPLSPLDKGMPAGMAPTPLDQAGAQGWNILREDLPLPLALLKQSALKHNSAWMQRFLQDSDTRISPHGKTTMSPQLFDLQLADGAWAITVSSPHHIQVARAFGYRRLVLANQLLGPKSIEFVLRELQRDPDFDFYCLVDSVEIVAILARVASRLSIGRPLKVLLEGGYPGGRTGCRDLGQAVAVARAVKAAEPGLALAGIEGFEGLIHEATPDQSVRKVNAFLDYLVDIAQACQRESLYGTDTVIVSAGGSIYYDLVCGKLQALDLGRPLLKLVRSGCYLTHDSSLYRVTDAALRQRNPELDARGPGLRPAIEVWAYVQSRPEPGTLIVAMGKRDVTPEPLPVALHWYRPDGSMAAPAAIPAKHVVTRLNDQHAILSVPGDTPLAVGDMMAFGIGHPCLTFDKWRVMTVVNDRYDVVSAIRTYF